MSHRGKPLTGGGFLVIVLHLEIHEVYEERTAQEDGLVQCGLPFSVCNDKTYNNTSIVNILFMAPRMVYCSIINLLWSLKSKMINVSIRQLHSRRSLPGHRTLSVHEEH